MELAVSIAVCDELTEATVAANEVAVAPAATVTLAGTVTAVLLLAMEIVWPVEGADALSVTVHVVELAPVNELTRHDSEPTPGAIEDDDDEELTLIETEAEAEPCEAVNFADCVDETAAALAVKFAFIAPAATVTLAGTVTTLLLLARLMMIPLLGATADSVTVQLSVAGPVTDALAHVSPDSAAPELEPLPCSFTVPDTVAVELVVALTVSRPVESVVDPGLYLTWTIMVPPEGMV